MRRLAVAALLPLAVAACTDLAAHDGERSLNRREMAPGPGLFSGTPGAWTIHRDLARPAEGAPTADHTTEGTTPP